MENKSDVNTSEKDKSRGTLTPPMSHYIPRPMTPGGRGFVSPLQHGQ